MQTIAMPKPASNLAKLAHDRYRERVLATARGDESDDLETLAICGAYGKTVTDFEIDVNRLKARFAAVDELATIDTEAPKLVALTAELDTARKELNETQARHQRELKAASDKFFTASHARQGAVGVARVRRQGAVDVLRIGADDAIDDKIQDCRDRIDALHDAINSRHHANPDQEKDRPVRDEENRQLISRLESQIAALESSKLDPLAFSV